MLIRDNGLSDDTCAILKEIELQYGRMFSMFSLTQGSNVGFGAGHNSNLSRSEGAYFLVSNVDLEFQEDTLTILVETALNDAENVASWECRQKPYEHPKLYHPATLVTNWSSSACALYKRSSLIVVGGFEPALFLYGEDVELSYRLRDNGYTLRYAPKAVVWHYTYEDKLQIKPQGFFENALANALLRFRYGSRREIFEVLAMYASLWLTPRQVDRRCYGLLKNGWRILTKGPHFLGTRKKSDIIFEFKRWDYGIMREGAFCRSAGMPETRPLVSILIRTMRGRLGKLREAVQSVINQTYSPIELIVVEDGSDCADKFLQTIANSGHIHSVNYRSAPKMGRSKAGNVALSMASGELIGFLDDDDLLFADHVETLVSELLNNPEVSGAYAMAFEVKTEALSNEPWRYREVDYNVLHRQDFSKAVLWDHNYIPIQSIIFRRRLYEGYGGFDEELENLEDWNLWVRYSLDNDFKLVRKVTSLYRVPANPGEALKRRKEMESFYQKLKAKQDRLPITLTVGVASDLARFYASQYNSSATLPLKIFRLVKRVIRYPNK